MKIRLEAVRFDRIRAMRALETLLHFKLNPKEKQDFINSLPKDVMFNPEDLPKIKEIFLTSEVPIEQDDFYNFPPWTIYIPGKHIPVFGDAIDLANKIIELHNNGYHRGNIHIISSGPWANYILWTVGKMKRLNYIINVNDKPCAEVRIYSDDGITWDLWDGGEQPLLRGSLEEISQAFIDLGNWLKEKALLNLKDQIIEQALKDVPPLFKI